MGAMYICISLKLWVPKTPFWGFMTCLFLRLMPNPVMPNPVNIWSCWHQFDPDFGTVDTNLIKIWEPLSPHLSDLDFLVIDTNWEEIVELFMQLKWKTSFFGIWGGLEVNFRKWGGMILIYQNASFDISKVFPTWQDPFKPQAVGSVLLCVWLD